METDYEVPGWEVTNGYLPEIEFEQKYIPKTPPKNTEKANKRKELSDKIKKD